MEAHNSTIPQCDLWVSHGPLHLLAFRPFKSHSQSVVCTHAMERDAVKIPARASYLHSQEGCNFVFKKRISHYFFFFFFWQLFEYLYGLHFMLDLHFTKDVSRNGKEGASCVEQSEMAEEKCCLAFCFHLNRCEWRWFLSPLTLCTRSSNRGKIL